MNDAERLGRAAFWGQAPELMALVQNKRGYTYNNQLYPANSVSLEETIETVAQILREAGETMSLCKKALEKTVCPYCHNTEEFYVDVEEVTRYRWKASGCQRGAGEPLSKSYQVYCGGCGCYIGVYEPNSNGEVKL